MADLTTLSTPTIDDAGDLSWEVPEGWQQGRGAFGGLVLGAMVRAARRSAPAERPLRSLTAELCGPVLVGPAKLRVEVLREGKGTTTTAVRLEQAGVQAHAVAVFGRSRAEDVRPIVPTPPVAPDWRSVPVAPIAPPLGPVFATNFEMRIVDGVPFSDGEARTSGYVRPATPPAAWDEALAVSLVDVWYPTMLVRLAGPRPMATLTFTAQVVSTRAHDPAGPFLHVGRLLAASGGYTSEVRELWSADGELLVINHQTIAIIQ